MSFEHQFSISANLTTASGKRRRKRFYVLTVGGILKYPVGVTFHLMVLISPDGLSPGGLSPEGFSPKFYVLIGYWTRCGLSPDVSFVLMWA